MSVSMSGDGPEKRMQSIILDSPDSGSAADEVEIQADAPEDRRIWGVQFTIEDADAESDVNVNASAFVGTDPFVPIGGAVQDGEEFAVAFDANYNIETGSQLSGGFGDPVYSEMFQIPFDWERNATLTFQYHDATGDQVTHGQLIVWYTEEDCPSRC